MSPSTPSLTGVMPTYLHSAMSYAQDRPLAATVAFAAGLIPLLAHVIPSYKGYMAIGPGGLPHNFLGWLMQAIAQPFGRTDLYNLAPYRDPKNISNYAPHGLESFLGDEPLPIRQGSRPEVPGYVAPQRQITETGDEKDVVRLNDILSTLASHNPDLLSIKSSGLEHPRSSALWVTLSHAELPSHLKRTKGELLHVHDEASSHTVLSLADAEELIRKGWALRHKMSGGMFPWTFVMIYAPRDEGEVEVFKKIVGAAVKFTCAQTGKKADLESL